MAVEIERKFLVKGHYRPYVIRSMPIVQGYLSSAAARSVRVRIQGTEGSLTIKGTVSESGVCRYEWEGEIPLSEARELLALCEPGVIRKMRHEVEYGGKVFEVDEFHGDNEGLVVAELELHSEGEMFDKPDWLGCEVTGNNSYHNVALTKMPYKDW